MSIKFLKPVEGRQVPDPERAHALMPPEGRNVEMSQFWQRRLDDGDVVEVEVAAAASAAEPAASKKGGQS